MKIPKITDISKWSSSWSGDTPKNLRIWKDTGTSYKPILSKIEKIKYVYHGTSLANAMKLLQTGVKSRSDDGLNVTTDLGYAMTYASHAVEDDPKTIVAIVAIPTKSIDWKRAQMSDNADDEQNAQILNNIPGSKLKIIAVATSSQNLKKAQSKLQEETNNLTNLISYLFEASDDLK